MALSDLPEPFLHSAPNSLLQKTFPTKTFLSFASGWHQMHFLFLLDNLCAVCQLAQCFMLDAFIIILIMFLITLPHPPPSTRHSASAFTFILQWKLSIYITLALFLAYLWPAAPIVAAILFQTRVWLLPAFIPGQAAAVEIQLHGGLVGMLTMAFWMLPGSQSIPAHPSRFAPRQGECYHTLAGGSSRSQKCLSLLTRAGSWGQQGVGSQKVCSPSQGLFLCSWAEPPSLAASLPSLAGSQCSVGRGRSRYLEKAFGEQQPGCKKCSLAEAQSLLPRTKPKATWATAVKYGQRSECCLLLNQGMWPIMTEVKKQGKGWATLNAWIWSIARMGLEIMLVFFFPSEYSENFLTNILFPHKNSFLHLSWLQPFWLFLSPLPIPQTNPLPTVLMADQPHSDLWESSKLPARCIQGIAPSTPVRGTSAARAPARGSGPWTNAPAGKSLWQSGTVQTQGRWAEYLMLLTQRGIQDFKWNFGCRIACRGAMPSGREQVPEAPTDPGTTEPVGGWKWWEAEENEWKRTEKG